MRQSFHILWPYLWHRRRSLLLGMGALIAKVAAAASLPVIIRYGIEKITGATFDLPGLWWTAGFLLFASAVKGLFQYWMRVILIGLSRDIEYDLRNEIFDHLVMLSGDFYARYRTGDLMARSTNDLNAVRMMLGPGVMYWTETIFTFVFAISVMVSVDWPLTLVALLPAPVVSLVVVLFGRRIHQRFEQIQSMFSDISSRVQENLSGVRVVRAYAQEQAQLAEFEALNQDYIRENVRLAKLSGLFMPLLQALIGLTFLIVLWVGGLRLLNHRISLGSFIMFNTYMGMLIWPMIALGWVVNLMQRGSASLSRIWELRNERPSIAAPGQPAPLPQPVRGEIRLENVSVQYDSTAALSNVSLTIPAGATVAIVGHTGSGKTTLVHLIPRLLDPTRGRVLLDGIDLRSLSPADLRRQIGFVPQETFLFSATLAENIAFGAPHATEEQIRQAAQRAGLMPDIEGFPLGLQTIVGERGVTLSGGQKQRTAIARAIIRDPQVLILDDALASVDTLTEERILTSLADIMAGRTTILISHRVSTVQHADVIFVLENGEIVEQGTHAALIRAAGRYADLHQKQLLEEELQQI